jgi:hypothetical protein
LMVDWDSKKRSLSISCAVRWLRSSLDMNLYEVSPIYQYSTADTIINKAVISRR